MQSKNYEELNPYKDKILNISKEIEEIESQKNNLGQKVKQYQRLDIRDHANKLSEITSEINTFTELKNSLRQELIQLKASLLVSSVNKFNPLNLFSKEKRELKKKNEEILNKSALLEEEINDVEAKLLNAYVKKVDLIEEVAFKEEFNLDKTIEKIENISNSLKKLIQERSVLLNKFDSVESGLKAIKDQLSIKNNELAKLKSDLITAENLSKRIGRAENSYQRMLIHQECEKLFGVGAPSHIISTLKKKIQSLEGKINKLLDRAKQTVVKLDRNISMLVIDGNNLCHQNGANGRTFINLKALKPLIKVLKNKYKVQVVFDETIKRSLDLHNIAARLELDDVHIVNGKADEFVLDLAQDSNAYVLSNDKFDDYFDKLAVIENRVLKYEMFNNYLRIYDLDVEIRL